MYLGRFLFRKCDYLLLDDSVIAVAQTLGAPLLLRNPKPKRSGLFILLLSILLRFLFIESTAIRVSVLRPSLFPSLRRGVKTNEESKVHMMREYLRSILYRFYPLLCLILKFKLFSVMEGVSSTPYC